MTVGELKKLLEGVPDNTIVLTMLDVCEDDDPEVRNKIWYRECRGIHQERYDEVDKKDWDGRIFHHTPVLEDPSPTSVIGLRVL